MWMFLETSARESAIFFKMKKACNMSCVKSKNIFLDDLLRSKYLLDILKTSLTVNNSENVGERGCFENVCDGERQLFFEMKEKYKGCCVEILIFC